MSVEYRPLSTVEELEQVVDLEIAVWGLDPRDAVPMNLMRPLSAHGGLVLGAFEAGRMVGMSLAFPARAGGKWVLWSHMTAVERAQQGRGIGFGLKQAQRQWALAHGYGEIRWTFDPLQPGNANFNLHLLGATADSYHVEYYGAMRDSINSGAGASDRVEARWKLKDRRVAALANGGSSAALKGQAPAGQFALVCNRNGAPEFRPCLETDADWRFVELPPARNGLDSALLGAWRLALRETLRDAFAAGFVAVDFVQDGGRAFYTLRRPPRWYLYVLRCADDSLYTGVSPDVEARLKKHQAGRGAAYTAGRRPVELLGAWQYPGRSAALKAEVTFKRLPRERKLAKLANREPHDEGTWVQGQD